MANIETRLRDLLPGLGSQSTGVGVVFFARLTSSDGEWSCYLAEGGDEQGRYVVRGWFLGVVDAWQKIALKDILSTMRRQGINLHLDEDFSRTTYADICGVALPRSA